MKFQIEITEEDAAALFANNWGTKSGKTVAEILQRLAAEKAADFRTRFPHAQEQALADFRAEIRK